MAALYVVGHVLGRLATIVIPVAVALLLAALLSPAVSKLTEWRVPRGVATTIVLIGGIAVVGGVLTFVIIEFSRGLPDLQTQVAASLDTIRGWLKDGPLHLSDVQLQQYLDQVVATLKENQSDDHLGRAHHSGDGRRGADRAAARAVHADLLPARR